MIETDFKRPVHRHDRILYIKLVQSIFHIPHAAEFDIIKSPAPLTIRLDNNRISVTILQKFKRCTRRFVLSELHFIWPQAHSIRLSAPTFRIGFSNFQRFRPILQGIPLFTLQRSDACTFSDIDLRIRAIRWKIRITRAAVSAAMQTIPDVALADTWILCTRMDRAFTRLPDSLLFGRYTPMMRQTAQRMKLKVDSVAHEALTAERYDLMKEYVEQYIRRNRPRADENVTPQNTTLAWIEFMKSKGIDVSFDSGSIADVVSDMSDKMSGQTGQFTNSLIWSKDILEIEWQRDSMSQYVAAQMDSLDRSFERIVVVMENIPEISDSVMVRFNQHVEQVLASLESSLDYVFGQVDLQRSELQRYVSAEREAIIRQTAESAQGMVQQALDQVPAIVSRVAVWLVLLAIVVLGLPFTAGYWVGTLRERTRQRKDTRPDNNAPSDSSQQDNTRQDSTPQDSAR